MCLALKATSTCLRSVTATKNDFAWSQEFLEDFWNCWRDICAELFFITHISISQAMHVANF